MSITPYIQCILAMVIVGSSVVAGKLMVDELPVFLASLIRFALATVLIVPVLYLREGGFPRISRRSLAIIAGQAFLGGFCFTVLLLYGLTLTSPAAAGVITATTPACMALMGWLFFADKPSLLSALGVALAAVGVAALHLAGHGSATGSSPFLGSVLVALAVVCESLFLLLRKAVREPVSPLAASTLITLFGLVFFAPLGLWELWTSDLGSYSATGWAAVAYYAGVVTVGAYLLWFAGITKVSAAAAGGMTAVMPLSAVVLSAALLGEPITQAHLAGCVLVLAAILLLALQQTKSAPLRRPAQTDTPRLQAGKARQRTL